MAEPVLADNCDDALWGDELPVSPPEGAAQQPASSSRLAGAAGDTAAAAAAAVGSTLQAAAETGAQRVDAGSCSQLPGDALPPAVEAAGGLDAAGWGGATGDAAGGAAWHDACQPSADEDDDACEIIFDEGGPDTQPEAAEAAEGVAAAGAGHLGGGRAAGPRLPQRGGTSADLLHSVPVWFCSSDHLTSKAEIII